MKPSFHLALGLALATSSLCTLDAIAQTPLAPSANAAALVDATTINRIDIVGNSRIEAETILSFLDLEEGESMDGSALNAALGRVYESGLFADVAMDIQGDILVVTLRENPIISQVAFENNKRISNDVLLSEVTLGPRSVYTKSAVQQDVRRILSLYQNKGRFSAEVNPKLIPLEHNRINLVYEIDEGEKSTVARILFVGNEAFSDSALSRVIATKETRWYRFLTTRDHYDQDRLEFDKELLRRHYVTKGYADFKVLSANAELTPDRKDFFVQYTVDEGTRYTYGQLGIESSIPDVDDTALLALLEAKEGEWFDASEIENSIEAISDALGDLGYAFVDITPQYKPNETDGVMHVNFNIQEGPRVYVENININGNVRTLDEVIRREFNIAEGDPYNSSTINRSKQKIDNLGFFKTVELDKSKGSAPDLVDINVDVEEQSTGELTFGAGFSTNDGALGDISIVERNLLGRGQYLKLNFTLSGVRQEVDLSFTEPYFMGRDFAAGFDAFAITRDSSTSTTNLTYDLDSIGGVVRGTYALTDYIDHTVRYSYRTDDITNVDNDASQFIQRQEGVNTTSLVGHTLTLDRRDNRFDPTEGYYVQFNQDIAGLGGDAKFLKHEVKSGYYQPIIKDDLILRVTGSAGHIFGYGSEDVRINDRFFIGSRQIRGFDSEGIGPRDTASLDPLGGNTYAVASAELGFPIIGLPEELGVTGALFSDVGTLFENDESALSGSSQFDDASPRVSVGVGLGWNSPFGPIRIDLAEAIVKEDYDEQETLRFSFGTRF